MYRRKIHTRVIVFQAFIFQMICHSSFFFQNEGIFVQLDELDELDTLE